MLFHLQINDKSINYKVYHLKKKGQEFNTHF
jgi:hypothetical protein